MRDKVKLEEIKAVLAQFGLTVSEDELKKEFYNMTINELLDNFIEILRVMQKIERILNK